MSRMNRSLFFTVAATMFGTLLCVPGASAQNAGPGAMTGTVTGTVTYRHRMALPPDAVVDVSLQDTSRADAPARIVGQTTIATRGAQVPIPFRINYDPAGIDPSHQYTVRATITVDGKVLFNSPTAYPVLTRGAGSDAAIEVYMILPAGNAKTPG
jgi:putative lipoprotein